MKEKHSNSITLHEIRRPIFLLLLEYVYTDNISLSPDTTVELMAAADNYGIPRLKFMCEEYLAKSLTINNASFIFHRSDLYSAERLRPFCFDYIIKNYDAISQTAGFKELTEESKDLIMEINDKRQVSKKRKV